MRYRCLLNRGVIAVTGEDARSFLQGLISQDVVTWDDPATLRYGCLLTPQGKFLHDFFLTLRPDGAIWLDCEADRRADLVKRLKIYKLRSKVGVEDLTDTVQVWAVWGEDRPESAVSENGLCAPDPRLPELGLRVMGPEAPDGEDAPFDAYDQHRLAQCVPDGSRDLEVERAILLENNMDELKAISWDKGCYMGQELTARTHYRGLVRKRLVGLRYDGEAPVWGSEVKAGSKVIGTTRSTCNGHALALVRMEDWEKAEGSITVNDHPVTLVKPGYLEDED